MNTDRRWTEKELRFLRKHYRGDNRDAITAEAIAFHLDRSFFAVKGKIETLKLTKKTPRWTPAHLQFLHDNYGIMPAEKIAKMLRRSKNALKIISYRKLRINQRTNIYSARTVAKLMGVG